MSEEATVTVTEVTVAESEDLASLLPILAIHYVQVLLFFLYTYKKAPLCFIGGTH